MTRLAFFAASLSLLAATTGLASAQQRFDPPSDQGRPDQARLDQGRLDQGRPDDRAYQSRLDDNHNRPRFEDNHDQRGPDHADWRRGQRMDRNDWDRGERVYYREHHFRKPPRGYEWRQVDGRFVLGAIATGVIAEIIVNGH